MSNIVDPILTHTTWGCQKIVDAPERGCFAFCHRAVAGSYRVPGPAFLGLAGAPNEPILGRTRRRLAATRGALFGIFAAEVKVSLMERPPINQESLNTVFPLRGFMAGFLATLKKLCDQSILPEVSNPSTYHGELDLPPNRKARNP